MTICFCGNILFNVLTAMLMRPLNVVLSITGVLASHSYSLAGYPIAAFVVLSVRSYHSPKERRR